ncbi:hypothetical protein [Streptomyces sp. NPDC006012]|uniref:hypothetical protein n=1 Tax=Streptomyces sp. NPDC006012 TaxID=3364739 RepID=UPI0036CB7DD3
MIRRGAHKGIQALEADIRAWVKDWNEDPKPFIWTRTAQEILDSLARFCRRISGAGHQAQYLSQVAVETVRLTADLGRLTVTSSPKDQGARETCAFAVLSCQCSGARSAHQEMVSILVICSLVRVKQRSDPGSGR